ncbi:MAG TPA: copper resistance protein CopC [Bryobacteraceae bacterium]|nr:copper resistance protein CopC [Bryobacteraceae bacterium]
MQKNRNLTLHAICLAFIFTTFSQFVFAHATPLQYVPAASSVLAQTPAKIQIHFSERVEPRVSSIVVIGPSGARADLADSAPDPADPRVFQVDLKDGGPGNYTVSWEVISSDDGHFAKGAYVFSVGSQGPAAAADTGGFQTVHSSSVPEASTLALELIGDALILGALLALAFIWRPMRRHFPEVKAGEVEFDKRFQFLFILGCGMALAGGLAYLLYKTDELASLQQTAFASAWGPFVATASAGSTIYRMLGVGFLLVAFVARKGRIFLAEKISPVEYAFFAVLVLIDFVRARISHAAASTFAPVLGVAMNFVHLLFKDVWIGGVLALVALFSPFVRKQRSSASVATFALTSFSRIASVALGVAGVTGVYVVWLHLKSFSFVLTTDWGKRFAVLSIFAALLLAARFFDELYCEPKIVVALQKNDGAQIARVFSRLAFTLPAEAAFGIAILAVTSLLIITTPPLAPHFSFARRTVSQGVALSLEEQPYESGKLLVTAADPLTNSGVDLKNMVVTLTNPAAGIGPIAAPAQERFTGGYVFAENLLAPPGLWTINITAQRSEGYDATAVFSVDYPREIAQSDAHSADRTFGAFEVIHILAAVLILALAILLYRKSSKLNRAVIAATATAPSDAVITFSRPGAWIAATLLIVIVLYVTGGIPAASSGVLEGRFQRACEDTNIMNVWHESVPERDGKATSDLAMPGCTTGIGLGQYHFVDEREFAYFIRPARTKAQLATEPAELAPNIPAVLTFTLRDYQGKPVQDLVLDHNRIVHVVIASEDFSVFAHIHAEDAGPITAEMLSTAVFPVRYAFPKPGRYLVSVDFMERGYAFSDQFYLNVGDSSAMSTAHSQNFSTRGKFDGYDVTLKTSPAELKAGVPATLDYHIEKDGRPLTEMTPYLAVPMHISIIRDDLMGFLHIHGLLPVPFTGKLLGESIHAAHLLLPDKFGPDIEATNFAFPSAGIYHIFGEFSVAGKVVVTQFAVKVQ